MDGKSNLKRKVMKSVELINLFKQKAIIKTMENEVEDGYICVEKTFTISFKQGEWLKSILAKDKNFSWETNRQYGAKGGCLGIVYTEEKNKSFHIITPPLWYGDKGKFTIKEIIYYHEK
jgi:hypothetical protein